MRFSMQVQELRQILDVAGRGIAVRTTIPVMQNVLLDVDAERDRLSVSTANGTFKMSVDTQAAVTEAGSLTVPGQQFVKYISSLSPGPANFELKDRELHVTAGSSSARFVTTEADAFPEVGSRVPHGVRVAGEVMRAALSRVSIAASTDEAHPRLRGVYFERQGDTIVLMAADGFRVARAVVPVLAEKGGELSAIVPIEAVAPMIHLPTGDEWGMVADSNRFVLSNAIGSDPRFSLDSSLVSGQYPDMARLIPDTSSAKTTVSVPVGSLRGVLARQMVFGKGADNYVEFDIWPDEGVQISSRDEHGAGRGLISASITGESMSLGFNGRMVDEYLRTISSDRVEIYMTAPKALVRFQEPEGQGDQLVYVVAPMHTR